MEFIMSTNQLSMKFTNFLPDTPQSESIRCLSMPRYKRFEEAERRKQALFESRRYPLTKREKDKIDAELGIFLRTDGGES